MKTKNYTEANRKAWNEVMPIHRKHRKVDYDALFSTSGASVLDELVTGKVLDIGIEGRNIAHYCCNNGVELLSLVNLGGRCGTGFDISDAAVEEARGFAERAGIAAEFVRTDLYDLRPGEYRGFDFVYFSIGGLCWLPDLGKVFEIVAESMVEGGDLLIYDMHPFLNMLACPGEPEYDDPLRVVYSYFKSDPWVSSDGIDYIGGTRYEGETHYDWSHTLSEIFNAASDAGLNLRSFDEHRHDISNLFEHLDSAKGNIPLCYMAHFRK